MTTIPDEIAEAGAKALMERHNPGAIWDLTRPACHAWLADARAILAAALPMLVRAEREACAKVANNISEKYQREAGRHDRARRYDKSEFFEGRASEAAYIATAIRARGER